jgi:hypothetical protein
MHAGSMRYSSSFVKILTPCDALLQIARQSLSPESSYIAKPAASWLDDFLTWMSPEAFGCCRKFVNGNYCPPDDQVTTFPWHTIFVFSAKTFFYLNQ